MPKKRSTIEQRKEKILAQIDHLRGQLASKTRKDFTTDFRHKNWIENSHALIEELSQELSILEEPGEYNELPAAVVADELGLSVEQVRRLITIGEIEATGKRAHERVGRKELERLARLGVVGLLNQSKEGVEEIFRHAVAQVRSCDVISAERSYRRLKARESSVGNYALSAEIAIQLVKGGYAEAGRLIKFIFHNKPGDAATIGSHVGEFLRGVSFKDRQAKADVSRVLKPLVDHEVRQDIKISQHPGGLEMTSLYITTVVRGSIEEYLTPPLTAGVRAEFYRLIKDSVFSALYADAHSDASLKCQLFVLSANRTIPVYWEPPKLFEELLEE